MPKVLLILLIALLGILPSVYLYWVSRKANRKHQWISYLLRWAGCSLLLALLFWPSFSSVSYKEVMPELIVVEDVSHSVAKIWTPDQLEAKSDFIASLKQQSSLQHLYFGANISSDTQAVDKNVSGITYALQHALSTATQTNAKGIILFSDGINNIGPSYNDLAAQFNIPVYVVGVGDSTKPMDIAIQQLYYNEIVTQGHDFEIVATTFFQKVPPGRYKITLAQQNQFLQQKEVVYKEGEPYQDISFILKANAAGRYNYTITLQAIDNELNIANNSATANIEVLDQKVKTLIVYTALHPDVNAIMRTLQANNKFEVAVKSMSEQPDFSIYDLIIGHQIRADALPKEKAKWLIGNEAQQYNQRTQSPQFNDNHPLQSILGQAIQSIEQWPPLTTSPSQYTGDAIIYQQDQPIWYLQAAEQQLITNGVDLWKWRMQNYKTNQNFDAFHQLVYQSLDLLTLKQQKQPLIIKGLKGTYYAHEAINVSAYVINKLGLQDNTYELSAKIMHEDQTILTINPVLYSNFYKLPVSKLGNGQYQLQVNATIDGKLYTVNQSFEVLAIDLESLQTAAEWSNLEQLATATNGQFVPIDSINTMNFNEDNLLKVSMKEEVSIKSLIDYKWLLALVLLIFIADWIIRKYLYA